MSREQIRLAIRELSSQVEPYKSAINKKITEAGEPVAASSTALQKAASTALSESPQLREQYVSLTRYYLKNKNLLRVYGHDWLSAYTHYKYPFVLQAKNAHKRYRDIVGDDIQQPNSSGSYSILLDPLLHALHPSHAIKAGIPEPTEEAIKKAMLEDLKHAATDSHQEKLNTCLSSWQESLKSAEDIQLFTSLLILLKTTAQNKKLFDDADASVLNTLSSITDPTLQYLILNEVRNLQQDLSDQHPEGPANTSALLEFHNKARAALSQLTQKYAELCNAPKFSTRTQHIEQEITDQYIKHKKHANQILERTVRQVIDNPPQDQQELYEQTLAGETPYDVLQMAESPAKEKLGQETYVSPYNRAIRTTEELFLRAPHIRRAFTADQAYPLFIDEDFFHLQKAKGFLREIKEMTQNHNDSTVLMCLRLNTMLPELSEQYNAPQYTSRDHHRSLLDLMTQLAQNKNYAMEYHQLTQGDDSWEHLIDTTENASSLLRLLLDLGLHHEDFNDAQTIIDKLTSIQDDAQRKKLLDASGYMETTFRQDIKPILPQTKFDCVISNLQHQAANNVITQLLNTPKTNYKRAHLAELQHLLSKKLIELNENIEKLVTDNEILKPLKSILSQLTFSETTLHTFISPNKKTLELLIKRVIQAEGINLLCINAQLPSDITDDRYSDKFNNCTSKNVAEICRLFNPATSKSFVETAKSIGKKSGIQKSARDAIIAQHDLDQALSNNPKFDYPVCLTNIQEQFIQSNPASLREWETLNGNATAAKNAATSWDGLFGTYTQTAAAASEAPEEVQQLQDRDASSKYSLIKLNADIRNVINAPDTLTQLIESLKNQRREITDATSFEYERLTHLITDLNTLRKKISIGSIAALTTLSEALKEFKLDNEGKLSIENITGMTNFIVKKDPSYKQFTKDRKAKRKIAHGKVSPAIRVDIDYLRSHKEGAPTNLTDLNRQKDQIEKIEKDLEQNNTKYTSLVDSLQLATQSRDGRRRIDNPLKKAVRDIIKHVQSAHASNPDYLYTYIEILENTQRVLNNPADQKALQQLDKAIKNLPNQGVDKRATRAGKVWLGIVAGIGSVATAGMANLICLAATKGKDGFFNVSKFKSKSALAKSLGNIRKAAKKAQANIDQITQRHLVKSKKNNNHDYQSNCREELISRHHSTKSILKALTTPSQSDEEFARLIRALQDDNRSSDEIFSAFSKANIDKILNIIKTGNFKGELANNIGLELAAKALDKNGQPALKIAQLIMQTDQTLSELSLDEPSHFKNIYNRINDLLNNTIPDQRVISGVLTSKQAKNNPRFDREIMRTITRFAKSKNKLDCLIHRLGDVSTFPITSPIALAVLNEHDLNLESIIQSFNTSDSARSARLYAYLKVSNFLDCTENKLQKSFFTFFLNQCKDNLADTFNRLDKTNAGILQRTELSCSPNIIKLFYEKAADQSHHPLDPQHIKQQLLGIGFNEDALDKFIESRTPTQNLFEQIQYYSSPETEDIEQLTKAFNDLLKKHANPTILPVLKEFISRELLSEQQAAMILVQRNTASREAMSPTKKGIASTEQPEEITVRQALDRLREAPSQQYKRRTEPTKQQKPLRKKVSFPGYDEQSGIITSEQAFNDQFFQFDAKIFVDKMLEDETGHANATTAAADDRRLSSKEGGAPPPPPIPERLRNSVAAFTPQSKEGQKRIQELLDHLEHQPQHRALSEEATMLNSIFLQVNDEHIGQSEGGACIQASEQLASFIHQTVQHPTHNAQIKELACHFVNMIAQLKSRCTGYQSACEKIDIQLTEATNALATMPAPKQPAMRAQPRAVSSTATLAGMFSGSGSRQSIIAASSSKFTLKPEYEYDRLNNATNNALDDIDTRQTDSDAITRAINYLADVGEDKDTIKQVLLHHQADETTVDTCIANRFPTHST